MAEPLRTLAIVAHPDDEAWCSGLLALQRDAGIEADLAVACNGNRGGMPDKSPDERTAIRHGEMTRAAEIIGCRLHRLDIGDDELMERFVGGYTDIESLFRDVIRRVDPDLLLLPHPDDYHHHHRAVSELGLNASVNAGNASVVSDEPPSAGVPITLYIQPLPPAPFTPDLYVDVSPTFDRKMRALACHESQHAFLRDHFGSDYVRLVDRTAEIHGLACGVAHAEAYALCRSFARTAPVHELARFFPRS